MGAEEDRDRVVAALRLLLDAAGLRRRRGDQAVRGAGEEGAGRGHRSGRTGGGQEERRRGRRGEGDEGAGGGSSRQGGGAESPVSPPAAAPSASSPIAASPATSPSSILIPSRVLLPSSPRMRPRALQSSPGPHTPSRRMQNSAPLPSSFLPTSRWCSLKAGTYQRVLAGRVESAEALQAEACEGEGGEGPARWSGCSRARRSTRTTRCSSRGSWRC